MYIEIYKFIYITIIMHKDTRICMDMYTYLYNHVHTRLDLDPGMGVDPGPGPGPDPDPDKSLNPALDPDTGLDAATVIRPMYTYKYII
jgi:hypothetical protein